MTGRSEIEDGDGRQLTVWYDGACPICSAEIRLIRRFDRANAIEFVDLRLPGECPADHAARLARFHAQARGGPMVSGAAAFVSMWRVLPGFQILAAVASPAPMLWALERGYLVFLRVRPALQAIARRLSRKRTR
jgi:predicted DCC family thiol-disulfide oxidoreductase YuxK